MRSLAIVDSGPLIAAFNSADPHHEGCVELLQSPDRDLIVPSLCVAEVAYLIGKRLGAEMEARFVAGLASLDVRSPVGDDWLQVGSLVEQYEDLPLGVAGASLLVLAEKHGANEIVTLDPRHFSVAQVPGVEVLFPGVGVRPQNGRCA